MNEALLMAVELATGVSRQTCQITPRTPLEIQSNALYDVHVGGRHLIAKLFLKAEELTTAPAREYSALQLLAPYALAPTPVFYDPTVAPVVVYEYLAGEMWDRRKPTAQQLARLAELWLTMHRLPAAGLWLSQGWEKPAAEILTTFRRRFEQYAAWCVTAFPPGNDAVAGCFSLLAQAQSAFLQLKVDAAQLCFCRADPRFANVIERPDGRLAYVDWEDCGLRDPARDLADLLTHPNQEDLLTWDEWQAFLQPYWAGRTQLDPTISARMHLYLIIFPLFWLSIGMMHGVKRAEKGEIAGWQINGLPANFRLRRYLARALAWPATNFSPPLAQLAAVQFFPTGEE